MRHRCISDACDAKCMGDNSVGATGSADGPSTLAFEDVSVHAENLQTSTLSGGTTCAINNKELFCWGNNSYVPTKLKSNVRTYYLGPYHLCLVSLTNELFCSGSIEDDDDYYVEGLTSYRAMQDLTALLPLTAEISNVWASHYTLLVQYADGRIYTRGVNVDGSLGIGSSNTSLVQTTFVEIPFANKPTSVSVSSTTLCALLTASTVSCWGGPGIGNINTWATYSTAIVHTPTAVDMQGMKATALSCASKGCCVITNARRVACQGYGGGYRLGNNVSAPFVHLLNETMFADPVIDVSVGESHHMLVDTSQTVWSVGSSTYTEIVLSRALTREYTKMYRQDKDGFIFAASTSSNTEEDVGVNWIVLVVLVYFTFLAGCIQLLFGKPKDDRDKEKGTGPEKKRLVTDTRLVTPL